MEANIIEINGVQLELDLLDADVLEKYDSLTREIQEKVNDPETYKDCKSNADQMRKQCRMVDKFFDELFGMGTAEEVFGDNNNLGKRLDGFGQVMEQASQSQGRITEITNKYNPQRLMNREQRRAVQFRKGGVNSSRIGS